MKKGSNLIFLILCWSSFCSNAWTKTEKEIVDIKIYIVHISDVSEAQQTFNAIFYLWTTWSTTKPEIELVNAIEFSIQEEIKEEHQLIQKINGTFFVPLDLKQFPFDRQKLFIQFEDFEKESRFRELQSKTLPDYDRKMELTDWRVINIEKNSSDHSIPGDMPEGKKFSRLTFSLEIKRRSSFYITRFFLPLLLLVCCSLLGFFLNLDYFDSMVNMGITGMLSVMALALSVNDSLPRVSYVVVMDRIFITCYIFIFASLVISVYLNYLCRNDKRDFAARLQQRFRSLFLPALVLIIALSFL